jgi:hypothetical protein
MMLSAVCPSAKAGIERDHFLGRAHGFVKAASPKTDHTERPKGIVVPFVELHRLSRGFFSLFQGLRGRGAPIARVVDHERPGQQGGGGGEARVEFDGAPEQRLRVVVSLSREPSKHLAAAQEAIVGFQIVGVIGGDALPVTGAEIERERRDDLDRHVVLHREDVGEVSVESLGPDVAACRGVYELRGDLDPVARFAHASLDNVAHAEALADFANVDVLALEGKRGIAGDDEELLQLRQRGEVALPSSI